LDKNDFQTDTQYTLTIRDQSESSRLHPADVYVMKLHENGLIVRMKGKDAILRKIIYSDIVKIVKTIAIMEQNRLYIPEALLTEKNWQNRTEMAHYSSSPHSGK